MASEEKKGTVFALMAAFVSGIAIPMNKLFVVDIDPIVFTAIRSILIGLVFLMLSYKRAEFKKAKKPDLVGLLLIAVIGGALAFLMFFTGLRMTTAGRGAFLHKTLPLYVTLLAFLFLKEKIGKKQLIALSLMFLGTIFVYFDAIQPGPFWLNPSLGDLLVICATFLWAVENVMAKRVMEGGNSNFLVSFSRMFLGGLILFGFVLLTGRLPTLLALNAGQVMNILISTLVLFSYVFFWYSAVKMINVSKASTMLLIAPVISMIGGILIFGEPTPLLQLVGSALILYGAYMTTKVKSDHLILEV
ncbi:hypothetical protein A3K63_05315 [Candidatus Micrarchaeota archaeon RBG_16_49_10]|nr:MAG: hypothetical protein A3K63_05315 [Candidatus Micrarchaeota archaeon RBG_16_49_10]